MSCWMRCSILGSSWAQIPSMDRSSSRNMRPIKPFRREYGTNQAVQKRPQQMQSTAGNTTALMYNITKGIREPGDPVVSEDRPAGTMML